MRNLNKNQATTDFRYTSFILGLSL